MDDTIRPRLHPETLQGGTFGGREEPAAGGEATLRVAAWPTEPPAVRQGGEQTIGVRGEVPVCIRVCEPICARSDYTIGITVFDRPVASVTVSGTTRIEACGGAPAPI